MTAKTPILLMEKQTTSYQQKGSTFLCLDTRIFYKQHFFSTQLLCCFSFSWIKLQMLLGCCLLHRSIIIPRNFLYSIFVSMSRRRPIYVLSMWYIFHFHLHFYRHSSSFSYFSEYILLFLDDNVMKNVNN